MESYSIGGRINVPQLDENEKSFNSVHHKEMEDIYTHMNLKEDFQAKEEAKRTIAWKD